MTVDDDQVAQAELFGSVFLIAQHLTRRADRELADLGITTRQWLLLAILTKALPGSSPSLSEAAERYGSSRQNVEQIALGLEARGFVRLVPDPTDARTTRIEVTERVRRVRRPSHGRAALPRCSTEAFAGLTPKETSRPARPGATVACRPHGRPLWRGATHMTRLIVAAVVAAHGVIHLIGFVVPWQIATVDGLPLPHHGGRWPDGPRATSGHAWSVLFGWDARSASSYSGIGIARRASWALPLTSGLAVVSLVACMVGLPELAAGVVVNVAILGAAAWLLRARSHSVEVAR